MPSPARARLDKRFRPLYAAMFLQGFVLWYPIDKLFARSIGFDDAGIGVIIAVYSVVMLVAETPAGILADRWSRKGVLMLASIAAAACALVCGLSYNMPVYLVGAALWGVFFALYSGTYDAIVYDTLLEEVEETGLYEKYYGRVQMFDGIALVLGAVLGGMIGGWWGLRSTFFLSVVPALLSLVALYRFKEPKLHKAHTPVSIRQQIESTFREVLRKRTLVPVLVALIVTYTLKYTLLEFSPLWLIALHAPVFLFGPAYGLLFSSVGIGGLAAARLGLHRSRNMLGAVGIMLLCSVGMIMSRNVLLTMLFDVVFLIGLISSSIVFTRFLHDALPSSVRSGASSASNTVSRLIMIPVALLFGFISKEISVFTAAWLFFGMLVLLLIAVIKTFSMRRALHVVTGDTQPLVEEPPR